MANNTKSPFSRPAQELSADCIIPSHSPIPLAVLLHEYRSTTDKWHTHKDFHEISIVVGGSACSENAHGGTQLKTGDVLFFAPQSTHRYLTLRNFRNYNVLFTSEILRMAGSTLDKEPGYGRFFVSGGGGMSELFSVPERDLPRLINLLENLKDEMLGRSLGCREAMYAGFLSLLVFLLRHCVPHSLRPAEQNSFDIGRVILHMERCADKPMSLAELAVSAGMSESSFRHHFRTLTGCAPIEYLIRLRLKRAVLLLSSPTMALGQVAFQAGFLDHNYFSRRFRQKLGCSPRIFRRELLAGGRTIKDALEQLG